MDLRRGGGGGSATGGGGEETKGGGKNTGGGEADTADSAIKSKDLVSDIVYAHKVWISLDLQTFLR